jgi:hypothetical protein
MLAQGAQFLVGASTSQGWGVFPDTDFDRRSSAVAIEALWTAEKSGDGGYHIVNATLVFKRKYAGQIRGLGADALADVVHLLRDEIREHPNTAREVEERASMLLRELSSDTPPDAVRRVAALLLALHDDVELSARDYDEACRFLLSAQHPSEGSWSAVAGGQATLTTTAEAVRALALFSTEGARLARDRGLRYLAGRVSSSILGEGSADTFEIATALRAIGESDTADYALVFSLVQELRSRQNADGGWPSRPDSPSAIEPTGLAVLALTAAGARSHVPSRLAQAMLSAAETQAAEIRSERDRLKRDVDAQVESRCRELMIDHKRLKEQVTTLRAGAERATVLERRVQRLSRIADPVGYESELFADSLTSPLMSVAGIVAAVVAISGALVAAWRGGDNLIVLVGASAAALGAAGLAVAFNVQVRNAQRLAFSLRRTSDRSYGQWDLDYGLVPSSHLNHRDLRRALVEIVEDWTPSAREELIYILYDQFMDVPTDVAGRIGEQVAARLGVGARSAADFASWASAVGLMPPGERRVLFEQLRRSVRP